MAAVLLANVSRIFVQCLSYMIYKVGRIKTFLAKLSLNFHLPGTLVPSATKVIAVMESFM